MKSCVLLSLVIISVSNAVTLADTPILLTLRTEVIVDQEMVSLRDLVETSVRTKTAALNVGLMPTPVRPIRLTALEISQRLESLGWRPGSFRFLGPQEITIFPAAKLSSTEPIAHPDGISLRRQIDQQLHRLARSDRLSGKGWGFSYVIPNVFTTGRLNFANFQVIPTDSIRMGENRIHLVGSTSEGRRMTIPFDVEVRELQRQLVTRTELPRGHRLRLDDLAWKLTESPSEPQQSVDEFLGGELTHAVQSQHPLVPSDLKRVTLVKAGEMVTAVCGSRGLEIRRRYRALSTAARGETVKLRSLEGSETLVGIATGPRLVRIPLSQRDTNESTGVQFVPSPNTPRLR